MNALEIEFTIGQAFVPDDVLAQYAATVAIVLNDLVLESSHLVRAAARTDRGGKSEQLHFFRLTAARYREAAKALSEWETEAEVTEFIASINDADREAYRRFKSSFTPWGKGETFVEKYIVPLRNNVVFHYPKPHETALRNALGRLRDTDSSVYAETDALSELRCEFADEVANQLAFGGFNLEDHEELRARISELSIYVTSLMAFGHAVISKYLATQVVKGAAKRLE